jgi:hypothetical protein
MDTHLSFECHCDSKVVRCEFGKDTELKSYDDFQMCMETLIEIIGLHIEESINSFNGCPWTIENIVCEISWQVDKIKAK